jgi:AcrR family transcriptional regulator
VTAHFLYGTDRIVLRPTKQARSERTRASLVDAAARTLATTGFQKASTQAVAAAAGCSQGALFKHFPDKAHLLAACVERILAGFVADFRADMTRRRAAAPRDLEDRLAPAVAALWRIFRRPEMQAVLEVYVAARTDEALGRALTPILERHREDILAEAVHVFPELGGVPDFAGVVDAVVYAMQGVVVGLFAPDGAADAAHLAFFQRLAARELEAAIDRRAKGARR